MELRLRMLLLSALALGGLAATWPASVLALAW